VYKETCLAIFVKSPDKGKVKTRLASVLDEDTVVEIYRRFVLDLLGTVNSCGFAVRIFCYPIGGTRKVADWLGGEYLYASQRGEDLGERMQNAFLDAFGEGFRKVVLIGTDFPDLPGKILDQARSSLISKDAVIGPALDGGYYLIGFNSSRFPAEVFREIDWGTPFVFQRTMDVLNRHGHGVRVLPEWRDIDTYEDLEAFMRKHERTPTGRLLTLDYLRTYDRMRGDEAG
jgi:uncharacterized protein